MKLAEVNEYIQTVAGLGALVALMAVGWEIREGNRIATQQAESVSWIQWIDVASSDLESGVARVAAKAAISPEELTLQDKMELNTLFARAIYLYSHDYYVQVWEANPDGAREVLNEVETDAPITWASNYSRAWIQLNKDWIAPELIEAIERGLENGPGESDLEYFDRLDALAATLE
jgi:hypothetical protein